MLLKAERQRERNRISLGTVPKRTVTSASTASGRWLNSKATAERKRRP